MTALAFPAQILDGRAILRVEGEGAPGFLHNLLTSACDRLQPGEASYGALLTPQGKILHDMFVVATEFGAWLDCAAPQADALLQKLVMYRLRAKLQLTRAQDMAVAVSSAGALPGTAYADPRLADMGWRGIVPAGSLAVGNGYDDARLALGLADSAADIGSGELFVQEANLDQLNGVSFTKGCYVGQEVVSRTHHRGSVRSRIMPVTFNAAASGALPHGADVMSGETRLGSMLSSHGGRGLALLRLDKLAEAAAPPMVEGTRLSITKPAWARFEVSIPEVAR